jgi:cell division protein FtsB
MNLERIIKTKGNYSNIFKLMASVGISLGLVVFSGLVIFDTLESFTDAYTKSKIVKEQEKRVAELRLKNLTKRQSLDYVISNSYVEKEARERFNYVKPGEVVFLLPEQIEEEKEDEAQAQVDRNKKPIEEWMEVLFN